MRGKEARRQGRRYVGYDKEEKEKKERKKRKRKKRRKKKKFNDTKSNGLIGSRYTRVQTAASAKSQLAIRVAF